MRERGTRRDKSLRQKGHHFAIFLLFPALAALGIVLGGWWLYAGLLYAFVIHPLLDLVVGPAKDPAFSPGDRRLAELLLLLPLPVHFALLALGMSQAPHLTPWQFYVAAYTTGLSGGVLCIDAGHELIHRKDRWQRGVGVALLALVSYAHFRIEHVFGHHRWVSTPRDPASARKGESIYLFWLRSIFGSYRSAWRLERENVAKKNADWRSNRMVHYLVLQAALTGLAWLAFGAAGLVFFLIQGAVAIWLLETINFIQHYGLERAEISPGRYEPVTPRHSWDTPLFLTNISLFNLGLHARHHESASVPFEELRAEPQAPVLPAGYSAMLLLSLVPPLWRAIMHPLVDKARAA